jgi:hypothetical protein
LALQRDIGRFMERIGYIRKFLKIKLETSNFSYSEEEYRRKAKLLDIDFDKLEYNPGLRFISKICLNSLWGIFGQNQKVKHSKYIDNEEEFYKGSGWVPSHSAPLAYRAGKFTMLTQNFELSY